MQLLNQTKLIKIKIHQQHPFHVLTSSKLPILIGSMSGLLALILVTKFHNNIETMSHASNLLNFIFGPLFSIGNHSTVSLNLGIVNFILFLNCAM